MRSTCIKEAVSLKVQFAIDRDENERLDLGIWAEIFHYIKHKEICTFSKTEDVDVSFILKKKKILKISLSILQKWCKSFHYLYHWIVKAINTLVATRKIWIETLSHKEPAKDPCYWFYLLFYLQICHCVVELREVLVFRVCVEPIHFKLSPMHNQLALHQGLF